MEIEWLELAWKSVRFKQTDKNDVFTELIYRK